MRWKAAQRTLADWSLVRLQQLFSLDGGLGLEDRSVIAIVHVEQVQLVVVLDDLAFGGDELAEGVFDDDVGARGG